MLKALSVVDINLDFATLDPTSLSNSLPIVCAFSYKSSEFLLISPNILAYVLKSISVNKPLNPSCLVC
ncbi:hypothetical protein SDC9_157889 [bioreactor metagenome]|uniref:Uncharacterized protein n=1 Tax=bioreactor metagenome TaxID=1076179 RepID=A0A645FDM2_9ZZZZ